MGGDDVAKARCKGSSPSFVLCLDIAAALLLTSFIFGFELFIQFTTVVSMPLPEPPRDAMASNIIKHTSLFGTLLSSARCKGK
jgi:hypothetical protein